MNAERCAGTEDRPAERAVDALLVERMPRLVRGSEEQRERLAFHHSRRDPHIVGPDPGGERVNRLVLASSGPVESESGDDVLAEGPQFALGIRHPQERVVHLRLLGDCAEQLHLPRSDCREQRRDVGRRDPGLEVVQQDVVRMLRRRKEGDVALLEGDEFFEVRLKVRVVRSRPSLDPGMLSGRDRLGLFRHELGRDPSRLLVVMGRHRDGSVGVGQGIELRQTLARGVHEPGGLVGDELLVRDFLDRGDHLAVHGRTAGWHVDLLVPLEEGGGVLEIDDLGDGETQFRKGVGHGIRITE